jgi:hypothetical protein
MEVKAIQELNNNNGSSHWKYWLKIWIKPRETMRKIINHPTNNFQVVLLVLLGGFVYALNQAAGKSMADTLPLIALFLPMIVGTVIGAAFYYFVIGGLFYWVGTLLGGTGTYRGVRLSLAYAYIPMVVTLVIWIPSLILFGIENFTTDTPRMNSSIGLFITFVIFTVIKVVIWIWSIFIYLKCLGEAHKFSAWRALLTVVLPIIVLLLIFTLVVVVL